MEFTKRELDPQDMTRYMAQYRYTRESHSDNSFSPTKRVDFLKDMTECERNDCEMLI